MFWGVIFKPFLFSRY